MSGSASPDVAASTPGTRTRILGAAVGAAVGAIAFLVLWAAAAVIDTSDVAIMELVAGPDGLLSMTGGTPFVWAVPPLAAALAGLAIGGRAARRRPWSGLLMGFVTYATGILLGTVLVLVVLLGEGGMTDPGMIFGAMSGMIGVAIIGAIVLAPLLVVCAVAGVVWAAIVRAVTVATLVADPDDAASPASTTLLVVMAIAAGLLGLAWLVVMWLLDLFAATTPVD